MYSDDIDKAYISAIDKFLFRFDNDHTLSASQIAEIEKYQRIFNLRDNPQPEKTVEDIWKDF